MSKGAPKGNKFWELRSKHGREKLFATPELFWEAACNYFQWCDDNPFLEVEQTKGSIKPYKDPETEEITWPNQFVELPKMRPYTFQGLCLFLNANVMFFNQFEDSLKGKTDDLSKDFSLICHDIREIIYNQKFSGAASGFFNPLIISRDLGLADKTESKTEVSTSKELTDLMSKYLEQNG